MAAGPFIGLTPDGGAGALWAGGRRGGLLSYLLPRFPASLLSRFAPVALPHDAALEQATPFGPDSGRVLQKLLVHGLREARVGRLEYIRIHVSHPD